MSWHFSIIKQKKWEFPLNLWVLVFKYVLWAGKTQRQQRFPPSSRSRDPLAVPGKLIYKHGVRSGITRHRLNWPPSHHGVMTLALCTGRVAQPWLRTVVSHFAASRSSPSPAGTTKMTPDILTWALISELGGKEKHPIRNHFWKLFLLEQGQPPGPYCAILRTFSKQNSGATSCSTPHLSLRQNPLKTLFNDMTVKTFASFAKDIYIQVTLATNAVPPSFAW